MKIKIINFIVAFLLLASPAIGDDTTCETSPLVKGECFKVVGSLYTFNGWPPSLRIELKDKRLFGVGPNENELIPEKIREVLPTRIDGEFELCPFGYSTSVPYDERKIEMVCIKSVQNAWYYDRDTSEKKKLK